MQRSSQSEAPRGGPEGRAYRRLTGTDRGLPGIRQAKARHTRRRCGLLAGAAPDCARRVPLRSRVAVARRRPARGGTAGLARQREQLSNGGRGRGEGGRRRRRLVGPWRGGGLPGISSPAHGGGGGGGGVLLRRHRAMHHHRGEVPQLREEAAEAVDKQEEAAKVTDERRTKETKGGRRNFSFFVLLDQPTPKGKRI